MRGCPSNETPGSGEQIIIMIILRQPYRVIHHILFLINKEFIQIMVFIISMNILELNDHV